MQLIMPSAEKCNENLSEYVNHQLKRATTASVKRRIQGEAKKENKKYILSKTFYG